MIFTKDITVLAGTTEKVPKEEIIKIAHGIITWFSVNFPNGCCGEVNCVILFHEHQIAPSTKGMTMIGDGFPIAWEEYYEVYQPPYELKVKLWSPDATYDHTITIDVAILPRKAIIALAVADAIKNIFGLLSPKRIFTRTQEVEY